MRLNNKWFSILMALGMTTFLMLVVTGIALLYIREMRISRLGYDEIVAYSSAQGAFEYAMLKVKNHPDGFEDSVDMSDSDGEKFFAFSTPRSQKIQTSYQISSTSSTKDFVVLPQKHLVLPLFTADEAYINGSSQSKKPYYNTGTLNTADLQISNIDTAQEWTIMATDNTTQRSVGITGNGAIHSSTTGIVKKKYSDCYIQQGTDDVQLISTDTSWKPIETGCKSILLPSQVLAEEIVYFKEESEKVSDFMTKVHNPYLILYNNKSTPILVKVAGSSAFTLPQYSVEARAGQRDTLQIFRFSEDKSGYYDLLKYGVSGGQ